MKNKIVELAIFQPYAYPWSKSELNLSVEEIDNVLKDIGLNNEVLRRKTGYELDIISYLVASKAKDYEDLKKRILEELKDRKYVSEILIKKELSKKHLANEDEVKAYIKFINNNMTIDEKNVFKKAIEIWLVDLFYYYKCAFDSNIKSDSVKEYILQVVEKNYTENKLNPIFIDRLRKIKAFNRAYILELVYQVSSNFKKELNELLEKYVSKDNNGTSESNFEDELFDIINDIPDLDLSCELESKEVDKKSDDAENISEVKDKMKENSSKDKKHDKKKENEIEVHLKGLAHSLGYKLIKFEQDFEEDSEIEILKDLASYKKGAVLSELYNAYMNFDNITKENLEAIINNFFNSLKLHGFEVDDTNKVGDKVTLDTKDLLSDFILTDSIDKKGLIEGHIKYLSWMYKGKKVTPMVIKPLSK
ncbi:MAG: hypothetical protein E7B46_11545 [Clostridium perfringens]|nr:hypothetical protein [Clostridium perfringens]